MLSQTRGVEGSLPKRISEVATGWEVIVWREILHLFCWVRRVTSYPSFPSSLPLNVGSSPKLRRREEIPCRSLAAHDLCTCLSPAPIDTRSPDMLYSLRSEFSTPLLEFLIDAESLGWH